MQLQHFQALYRICLVLNCSTDDFNIENYTSQHIQWSTDVGKHSFQIRNIVKTEESPCGAPEEANLVQMQSSPYPPNLHQVNLHEEINEGTQDVYADDSINDSKEIIEVEVSYASSRGHASMCPKSSAGMCSNFALRFCVYTLFYTGFYDK